MRDRSIPIDLLRLPKEERRTEKGFWGDFEKAWLGILGSLLNGLSIALRDGPTIRLPSLPRMVDFAESCATMESAFRWEQGSFIAVYEANIHGAAIETIDASPIGTAIVEFARKKLRWEGTAAELLHRLQPYYRNRQYPNWAKAPNQLTGILNRLQQRLLSAGVDYSRYRRKKMMIVIEYIGDPRPQLRPLPGGVNASMEIGPSTESESHDKPEILDGVDGIDVSLCSREKKPKIHYWRVDDEDDKEDDYCEEESAEPSASPTAGDIE